MVNVHRCRVAAVLVVLVALSTCAACFADADADYSQGLQLQHDKEYLAAIREFAKVPADSTLAAKASYETSMCWWELMNLDEALAACGKGIGLAVSAEDRSLFAALRKDLRLAIPNELMRAQRWDEAILELQPLIQDFPEDAKWMLANCYMAKENYQAALDTFASLVNQYPGSAMRVTYDALKAQCMFFVRGDDDAIIYLTALIERISTADPYVVENVDSISQAMVKAGRKDSAMALYKTLTKAVPSHPINVAWKVRLAEFPYRQRDWKAARASYDAVCRDYPNGIWHTAAEYMAADCSEQLGDSQDAVRRFRKLAADHVGTGEAKAATRRLRRLND